MVSWHMVLFGITHLRLDIFITWWMSIFQSTVVLRHFASLSVHHCILGRILISWITRPSVGFVHLLVVDPLSCHTGAYPLLREHQTFHMFHSLFDLVVGFLGLSYWGIPSFPRIIGPFTGFIIFWPSCQSSWVVILGHILSYWVCLHHYLSYPLALSHLIRSSSC